MNAKTKKTIKRVIDVVLWIFLVFAFLLTIVAFASRASSTGYPVVGNKMLLTVATPSMDGENGFKAGDLIICEILDDEGKKNLKEGDVITFTKDVDFDGTKDLNTHRIAEVWNEGAIGQYYKTKGDANPTVDPYEVYPVEVEAKWTGTRLAGLGSVLSFLQGKWGFFLCIVLPLALFFVYEVVMLVLTIKKVKGENGGKKPSLSKEEEELIKQRAIEEYLANQAKQKAENEDQNDSSSKE